MYDDFTFLGRHISEFGGMAFLGEGFAVGDKIRRSEYALPGGGSVVIGRERHGTISRTIEILPVDGVSDTAAWRRRLLSWLMSARGFLTWDHDPSVRMTAQFNSEGSAGTKVSPVGGISLRCTVYGVCEDAIPAMLSGNMQQDIGGYKITFSWRAGSTIRTPLTLALRANSGTLSSASVMTPNGTIRFSGMGLGTAQELVVSGEDGDLPASVTEAGILTFAHVAKWSDLSAAPGDTVTVTANTPCFARLTGRGKWIVG